MADALAVCVVQAAACQRSPCAVPVPSLRNALGVQFRVPIADCLGHLHNRLCPCCSCCCFCCLFPLSSVTRASLRWRGQPVDWISRLCYLFCPGSIGSRRWKNCCFCVFATYCWPRDSSRRLSRNQNCTSIRAFDCPIRRGLSLRSNSS